VASAITSSGNQTVGCNVPALPTGAKGFGFRICAGGTCGGPQIASSG